MKLWILLVWCVCVFLLVHISFLVLSYRHDWQECWKSVVVNFVCVCFKIKCWKTLLLFALIFMLCIETKTTFEKQFDNSVLVVVSLGVFCQVQSNNYIWTEKLIKWYWTFKRFMTLYIWPLFWHWKQCFFLHTIPSLTQHRFRLLAYNRFRRFCVLRNLLVTIDISLPPISINSNANLHWWWHLPRSKIVWCGGSIAQHRPQKTEG